MAKTEEEKIAAKAARDAAKAARDAAKATKAAEGGEEPKKVQGATALAVHDKDGKYVRTYTTDMEYPEGKDMVSSAEGFAQKIGGSVKKVS